MIDELVFRKAQKGDKESLNKLITPIQTKLYKAAYAYVGNENDALDCVHDGIVKAIKKINDIKEPQYFNTWISKIVVNTCKDFIKKNNKVAVVDIQEYSNELICNDRDFEEIEEIRESLSKLSEQEREIIILRYLEDKSLKDIATQKVMPVGTVKSSINRSIKKLRLCLGGIK